MCSLTARSWSRRWAKRRRFASGARRSWGGRGIDIVQGEVLRLRIHSATANEELVALVNEGYDALAAANAEYRRRKGLGQYDDSKDVPEIVSPIQAWTEKVAESLQRIFPTELEANLFLD